MGISLAGRRRNGKTCLFCLSRKTYTRIVTRTGYYDEIACNKHVLDLEKDADFHFPGTMKLHISGTIKKRGDPINWVDEAARKTP